MAKMIKNLTVANIRNIEGMERKEVLDFSDDGNRFRGFSYKGMPITTIRKNDETYLSIRVDYLDNKFTYKEWMNTEEYYLCNEFNGAYEFDLDKLIENLEKIIAKVAEMNEKAANEVIDTSEVEARLSHEIEYATSIIEDAKKNFKWYEANEYVIKKMVSHINSVSSRIERIKKYDFNTMDIRIKRTMVEKLRDCGYIEFQEDNFFLTEIKKYLKK